MIPSAAALTRRGWTLTGAASGLLLAGRLLGALELTILGVITFSLLLLAWLWVRSRTRWCGSNAGSGRPGCTSAATRGSTSRSTTPARRTHPSSS